MLHRLLVVSVFVVFVMCIAGGCAATHGTQRPPGDDVVGTFRDHLQAKRFYEAFLMLDQVMTEMKDVPEDAAGFECAMAVATTASTGQHDWVRILSEPSIPLKFKIALTEEIHEEAIKTTGSDLE